MSKKTTMPTRPHAFVLRLSDDERAALVALATARRITMADAARLAVMADAARHGVAA